MTRVLDPVRLALGTLTVLPVRPPGVVDRRTASWAMVLAPWVGLLLAAPATLLLWLLGTVSALLASVLVVGLLAWLTRAIHLDGLADTADGLGSGRPREGALEVMRRGDVGPFGVVTLLLVLMVQVAALAELVADGRGAAAVVVALVVSRLALPLLCSRGVPAARPDGLGALVAGSVGPGLLALAVLLAAGPLFVVAVRAGLAGAGSSEAALLLLVTLVTLVGLLAGLLVAWRAVRRLGGVTGDVLGAAVEVTFTMVLVVLAATP